MISTDTRDIDKDDVGVLFWAMCKFGEENEEETDISLVAVGFGELLSRAERAAEVIAECHKDEGDNWDGCLWLERLEDIDGESLAAQLFLLENDHADMVSITTVQWLQDI